MHVSLTVVGGTTHGRVVPVVQGEFRIGRDSMCHLRPVSTEIARLHCAIVTHPDGRVFLRDFGSPSGTMINRRTLIGGEFEIQDGDNLEIGPLKFRITLQRTSSTSPLIETKSHKKLPRTAPLPVTPPSRPADLPGLIAVSSVPSPGTLRDESALETTPDLLTDSHIFSIPDNSSFAIPELDPALAAVSVDLAGPVEKKSR